MARSWQSLGRRLLQSVYSRDGSVLAECPPLTLEDLMLFVKQFRSEDHTRAFVVADLDDRGWEVRVEQDNEVVTRTWLRDWHRVENAMMRFGIQAVQLQSAGWTEVHAPGSSLV